MEAMWMRFNPLIRTGGRPNPRRRDRRPDQRPRRPVGAFPFDPQPPACTTSPRAAVLSSTWASIRPISSGCFWADPPRFKPSARCPPPGRTHIAPSNGRTRRPVRAIVVHDAGPQSDDCARSGHRRLRSPSMGGCIGRHNSRCAAASHRDHRRRPRATSWRWPRWNERCAQAKPRARSCRYRTPWRSSRSSTRRGPRSGCVTPRTRE